MKDEVTIKQIIPVTWESEDCRTKTSVIGLGKDNQLYRWNREDGAWEPYRWSR